LARFFAAAKIVTKANVAKPEHRAQLASTERNVYAVLYDGLAEPSAQKAKPGWRLLRLLLFIL
jgi:hypothetical protein